MASQGNVVVTGGAGFVGSHVVVELLEEGYGVLVIDKIDDAKQECLRRIQSITGKNLESFNLDVNDVDDLRQVFKQHSVSSVIHLAAMKFHAESSRIPLEYYKNNIGGLVNLLTMLDINGFSWICSNTNSVRGIGEVNVDLVMKEFGVHTIIYASTVAVYGTSPESLPLKEKLKVGDNLKDAYSRTKYFSEEILRDVCRAEKGWSAVVLRFFNPVGAHKSGMIGERMIEKPPNMIPNLVRTAMGQKSEFIIYGGKYDTKDGTGERDYTHVVDIAKGHVAAVKRTASGSGLKVYNFGSGRPCTSLDMLKSLEKVSGKQIPYTLVEPRTFDAPSSWADVSLAKKELGWSAELNIMDICVDAWRWYTNNPTGYNVMKD